MRLGSSRVPSWRVLNKCGKAMAGSLLVTRADLETPMLSRWARGDNARIEVVLPVHAAVPAAAR
jgi:hypothetical protein